MTRRNIVTWIVKTSYKGQFIIILCLIMGFAVVMKKKGGDAAPSSSDARAVDNPTYESGGKDGTKGKTDGFGFGGAAKDEGYLEVAAK